MINDGIGIVPGSADPFYTSLFYNVYIFPYPRRCTERGRKPQLGMIIDDHGSLTLGMIIGTPVFFTTGLVQRLLDGEGTPKSRS